MKDRLSHLINNHGLKHWAIKARRDSAFVAWVNAETIDLPDASFMVRVYCATHGERPMCANGQDRKLKGIVQGWGFCGPAKSCPCARSSVSQSVKQTKAQASVEDRAIIQAKREATNLATYGHRNSAQTVEARTNHAAFYADPGKVAVAMGKHRGTMVERYGVENGFQTEAANAARLIRSPESIAAGAVKRQQHALARGLLAKSYPKLIARLSELGFTMTTPFDDYRGLYGHEYYQFICGRCGGEFSDYLFASHDPTCPACDVINPVYVSNQEKDVQAFIEGLGLEIVRNSKKHIRQGELDILVPKLNVAIEYCGLYWHSETQKPDPMYHRRKLERCNELGIRLITLFSDEWLLKQDICKSRLRHILGVSTDRLYARQVKVETITGPIASEFLLQHHIQGSASGASVNLGLVHEGVLVGVMTFGKARVFNGRHDDEWELYRFATRGSVVGGASKLFQHFVRSYHPKKVISYCDLRWGTGGVYRAMGFEWIDTTRPSYFYLEKGYQVRHHRYTFAKHILVKQGYDPNKSETNIMRDRGYDRIWDCGTAKFLWQP